MGGFKDLCIGTVANQEEVDELVKECKRLKEINNIVANCARREKEHEYWDVYAKLTPGSSGVAFDEIDEFDADDLLDEIEKAGGFELDPDPWEAPVTKPRVNESKLVCECGLGTDELCDQHFEYCKCYRKESK